MASSPSAPTIPPSPSESQSQPQTDSPSGDKYNNNKNPLIHTVALGVTPLALIALCLPPRRLDLRATMLGGVALWGTNQLAHDFSGKSFAQRVNSRMASLSGAELPEKAKATQARLREEKERRETLRALREEMIRSGAVTATGEGLEGWTEDQKRALLEAYEKQRREKQQGHRVNVGKEKDKGILERVWMGDAAPDWKEKRDKKEKEALQEGGGGYLGLITDQIAEVWRGKKTDEGDASKGKTGEDSSKS
ncbi:hypothetical protein F4801DRAFT_321392 [Xylaria longipes]|nr:hypothetical protein F4801DRAFT_321392 [Xylaria longipes]RYC64276.1 hypothetical protein CHU98_g1934 [Xylaria longipes]